MVVKKLAEKIEEIDNNKQPNTILFILWVICYELNENKWGLLIFIMWLIFVLWFLPNWINNPDIRIF